MKKEIHCSSATVAADFDLGQVARLTATLAPPNDLTALLRRYRSARAAVLVQCLQTWLQRAEADLPAPDRRGIVLGTATGAGADIEFFLEESVRVGDHLVNPALFAVTVHNAAAGSAAIAGQCRGPNVVLSAGTESVWSALSTAQSLLRDNSADLVFVGGVESHRLADGATGTIATFIALCADPAPLGGLYLAPLAALRHRAEIVTRSAVAPVAALVDFAHAFAPETVEPGGAVDGSSVSR